MTVIIAYIRLHTTKHPAIYAEIYKYHRSCVCVVVLCDIKTRTGI